MNFEVYCDEAHPELFTSVKPKARYLMIGSLWLPAALRDDAKMMVNVLRERHSVWGEIKWTKISPSKQAFYEDLIDLFCSFGGDDMRFRCIAIDRKGVDYNLMGDDGTLGFYKFYYQLLRHWMLDFNHYRIFCDLKSNRNLLSQKVLLERLLASNLSVTIDGVQSLPSKEVVLLQLCDVLLGAASSRINNSLGKDTAKEAVVKKLEDTLGVQGPIQPSGYAVEKFNVTMVDLDGGW